jgi:pimeloyl-ACP methyl ester carboxylesterase
MTETITHWIRPPHGGRFPITDSGDPAGAGAAALPLALVPGIGGPRGTFYHQVEEFRQDRRAVALNLNPTRRGGARAIESGADDIAIALDQLDVERADVLAASFGALVATLFALRYPSRVRRLVWVAPPVVRHAPWRRTFGPGWLVGGALLAYSPPAGRRGVAEFLARTRMYSPEPDLSQPELELLGGRATETQLGPFFERLYDLARWDWGALPAPFPAPLLVIQGATERAVTPQATFDAWRTVSGRDVVIVPGHHMPYLSYPREFNAVLRSFLDARDAAPAA